MKREAPGGPIRLPGALSGEAERSAPGSLPRHGAVPKYEFDAEGVSALVADPIA
jgi:hypothetical protein